MACTGSEPLKQYSVLRVLTPTRWTYPVCYGLDMTTTVLRSWYHYCYYSTNNRVCCIVYLIEQLHMLIKIVFSIPYLIFTVSK